MTLAKTVDDGSSNFHRPLFGCLFYIQEQGVSCLSACGGRRPFVPSAGFGESRKTFPFFRGKSVIK
jgi:hypothetical protein